jgi:hypothetical protein
MSSRDTLRARLSDITAEMEKLSRHERPTRTQELRFNDLQTEFADTSKLIADADRQALRSLIDSGNYSVEAGTIPAHELEQDRPGVRSEIRGRALDLVERSEKTAPHLSHDALETATRIVERGRLRHRLARSLGARHRVRRIPKRVPYGPHRSSTRVDLRGGDRR